MVETGKGLDSHCPGKNFRCRSAHALLCCFFRLAISTFSFLRAGLVPACCRTHASPSASVCDFKGRVGVGGQQACHGKLSWQKGGKGGFRSGLVRVEPSCPVAPFFPFGQGSEPFLHSGVPRFFAQLKRKCL